VTLEVNLKKSTIGAIFLWLIIPDEALIRLTIKREPRKRMTTRKKITRSNCDVLAAFVSKKSEIGTMLARFQALIDDHFGYAPDDVTWSHVGTLEHYAELLKRITDSAFKEGEHAD
jgi:hypothetical protein